MLTVSVTLGESCCDIGFDSDAYSAEVIEDMCKRAAGTVLAIAEVERQET